MGSAGNISKEREMTDVSVKQHTRRKPAKPEIYVARHEQLRREVRGMCAVSEANVSAPEAGKAKRSFWRALIDMVRA
jgi:hypothetical protein